MERPRKKKSADLRKKRNLGKERQVSQTKPVEKEKGKKVRNSQEKDKEIKRKAQHKPNGGLKPETRKAKLKAQLIATKQKPETTGRGKSGVVRALKP